MKMYGKVKVQLHAVVSLALDTGECLISRAGCELDRELGEPQSQPGQHSRQISKFFPSGIRTVNTQTSN
jgi:hypothetical protein